MSSVGRGEEGGHPTIPRAEGGRGLHFADNRPQLDCRGGRVDPGREGEGRAELNLQPRSALCDGECSLLGNEQLGKRIVEAQGGGGAEGLDVGGDAGKKVLGGDGGKEGIRMAGESEGGRE